MSYGADFITADPANAPLDAPLLIGADPFVWAAILLLLAAALLAGYFFGARSNSRRTDAAQAIWKAVHEAGRSAMGADDNALKGRAEALLKVLDGRLGDTLGLIGGLSGSVGQMRDAVNGRRPSEGHGAGHDHGGGHGGHGDGAHAPAHDAPDTHGARPAAAPAVTIVNVIPGVSGGHQRGHAHASETRGLTQREQTDALRLAVAAFNQHWRDESARIRELRAAHAELSGAGSAGAPAGRISGTRAKH